MSDKDFFTADELNQEIKKHDPEFDPDNNVYNLHKDIYIADYKFINYEELASMSPEKIEYVLYPCLPTQGIGFIYAATGIGKTLFTLNLAYAIANGGSFLKYTSPKPRKVLYVDGEMPFNQIYSRVMQVSKQQGVLDFKENFNILTPDKIPFPIPKIDDQSGQNIYQKLIEDNNFEVVIFDNISMLSSFDENKAHEWTKLQDYFLSLRSKGITIIAVHHAGKDKNGYRGSSRMLDCADAAISLQPVNDDNVEEPVANTKKFKIVYQKARNFSGNDAMPYEVILQDGQWSYRSVEQSLIDKVIDSINAGMSQREIAKELFVSQTTIFRLIKKARLTGRVR